MGSGKPKYELSNPSNKIHNNPCMHIQMSTLQNKQENNKKQMGRGHNFMTPTKTMRKTRKHKKKTRLNFKFTYCIYMLNNEITKYINK